MLLVLRIKLNQSENNSRLENVKFCVWFMCTWIMDCEKWCRNKMQMLRKWMYFPKKPHLLSRVREESGGRDLQWHLRSFPQTPDLSQSGSCCNFYTWFIILSREQSVDYTHVLCPCKVFLVSILLFPGKSWWEGDCWHLPSQTGCTGTS